MRWLKKKNQLRLFVQNLQTSSVVRLFSANKFFQQLSNFSYTSDQTKLKIHCHVFRYGKSLHVIANLKYIEISILTMKKNFLRLLCSINFNCQVLPFTKQMTIEYSSQKEKNKFFMNTMVL